jgi:hypothetical protein
VQARYLTYSNAAQKRGKKNPKNPFCERGINRPRRWAGELQRRLESVDHWEQFLGTRDEEEPANATPASFGKYRMVRPLGAGGQASTLLAWDLHPITTTQLGWQHGPVAPLRNAAAIAGKPVYSANLGQFRPIDLVNNILFVFVLVGHNNFSWVEGSSSFGKGPDA